MMGMSDQIAMTISDAELLELLELVSDMEAEGVPHSRDCGCELCCHYQRAVGLAERHDALYQRLKKEVKP